MLLYARAKIKTRAISATRHGWSNSLLVELDLEVPIGLPLPHELACGATVHPLPYGPGTVEHGWLAVLEHHLIIRGHFQTIKIVSL